MAVSKAARGYLINIIFQLIGTKNAQNSKKLVSKLQSALLFVSFQTLNCTKSSL